MRTAHSSVPAVESPAESLFVTAAPPTIRVLIADDQEMVRSGFRLILEAQPNIRVVGEVGDGLACVTAAQRLRPDVCLVDVRMPGLDGLGVTRLLAGSNVPDPLRVVVVTTFDQDDYVYGALHGGACGFLLKDAGPELLVAAVRAAHRGDTLVSPSITVRLLERLGRLQDAVAQPPDAAPPCHRLSERELDVARLVARGLTNQEICERLSVSLGTVKAHLGNIQTKLGVRNRVEIAAWAWETGQVGRSADPESRKIGGSAEAGPRFR